MFILFSGGYKMDELKESINRGIPIATPVTLSSTDLIALCDDKETTKKAIDNAFTKYMNYMKKIGIPPIDMEFFQTLGIVTNPNTLEKQLCFSRSGFMMSIFMNLNIDNMFRNRDNLSIDLRASNEELSNALREKAWPRLEIFKNLKTKRELKREFPALYKKYQERQEMMPMLRNFVRLINQKSKSGRERIDALQDITKFLEILHLDNIGQLETYSSEEDFTKFCAQYYESLSGILNHSEDIMQYLDTHRVNTWHFSSMDRDKISLYIASRFLSTAITAPKEEAQRYLYNVTDYFRENENRKTATSPRITIGKYKNESMGIKSDGVVITPKSLYSEYKKMLLEHPELRVVDFSTIDFTGMNLEEAEKYTQQLLSDLAANWELIPASHLKDDFRVSGVRVNVTSEEERRRKIARLADLYIEKKEFYDSTSPICRVVGKNTFSGYVGHIYSNGKVILDRFFENDKTGRIAEGHAIYIMDATDFCKLSSLSKRELFHHPSCKRIYHAGDWQSRVSQEIAKETKGRMTEGIGKILQMTSQEN